MSTPASPARLQADATTVLVVDVQEKLMPKIHGGDAVIRNIAFLLDACKILGVPAAATEQYPKGLGATVSEIARRLPSPLPSKLAFSCCGSPEFMKSLAASGRPTVLVVGIETHVCVLNTVLDLLAQGLSVFIAVDAISCRSPIDHDVAVRRMELAGAIPCTVEAAVFEFTRIAGTPTFKEISLLVQERMKSLAEAK
jgi:nicotinamidase-related amidase